MPHDTLFITDLHGNLDALRGAVEIARRISPVRHLIVGGDVAPNLVTVRLRDGEYVLHHEARYGSKVAEDFRARLKAGRRYRAADQHGKHALVHSLDLETAAVLQLGDRELQQLIERPSGFDHLRERQAAWVNEQLLPELRRYHGEGTDAFVMLGNDDFVELEELLLAEERRGTLRYLHGKICALGRSQILGYSCVLSKPFRYRHWERTEGEIGQDLAAMIRGLDPSRLVLSVHMPPYGTNLDRLGPDGRHIGSRTIRELLERERFALGLFGHIHESPQLSGARHDRIGQTVVINPGGFHDTACCAVIFDSAQPEDWRGLW